MGKKKAISFSMTDEQAQRIEDRVDHHGFLNKAEYLLCLWEMDCALDLRPVLNEVHQKILRPAGVLYPFPNDKAAAVAEGAEPGDEALAERIAERVAVKLGRVIAFATRPNPAEMARPMYPKTKHREPEAPAPDAKTADVARVAAELEEKLHADASKRSAGKPHPI